MKGEQKEEEEETANLTSLSFMYKRCFSCIAIYY